MAIFAIKNHRALNKKLIMRIERHDNVIQLLSLTPWFSTGTNFIPQTETASEISLIIFLRIQIIGHR